MQVWIAPGISDGKSTTVFYPSWSSRYPVKAISYSSYAGGSLATTGRFTWTMGNTLNDPEGLRDMGAADVLKRIFNK